MRITKDSYLGDFEFWSGGKDNAAYFTSDELEALDNVLDDYEELGMDYPFTETDINDLFWFEPAMLMEMLGAEDGEAAWEERVEQHDKETTNKC